MKDFIEGTALFSDIYASGGIKIVLSGTDSLGFLFTESEELYDRCITIHTTFISYREFERVLGIKGIDEYIDRDAVEKRLMQTLKILNIEDQTVDIDEACALEIKEYLSLLDLTIEIDEEYLPVAGHGNKKQQLHGPV